MKCHPIDFILVMLVVCAYSVLPEQISVRHHPRFLVFPPGLGNKLQIICGFGVPIDAPHTSLTYGLILKTNYVLPTNATQFTDPYVAFARRGAASRWHLYQVAEAVLARLGLGGRDCLLRSVCEGAEIPLHHDSILGEILHILLTPTSTEDEPIDSSAKEYYAAENKGRALRSNASAADYSCASLYPNCGSSLLDIISTLMYDTMSSIF